MKIYQYINMLSLLSQNNILYVKDALTNSPNFLNVKHDTELNLYIAKHCHASDKTQQVVRECDGIILNPSANIVCYSGEYSEIYSYYDCQNDNNVVCDAISNLANYEVMEFLDGTCIRMYYHNNTWKVATKGHTDAGKAKWNSNKSFLELFNEVLVNYPNFNQENLNRNYTYVFILQHVENRIVCPIQSNNIYLLEVYENSTMKRQTCENVKVNIPKVLNITHKNDLMTFLELNDETSKGLYLRHNTSGHRMFIMNKLYEERQRLKGNTLDMNKHYLELRSGNKHYNFIQQFPEYTDMANEIEKNISDNVRHIHTLYMAKHIRKENVQINVNERKYLYPIHGFHLRTHQKITPEVTFNLMFCINPQFGLENLTQ